MKTEALIKEIASYFCMSKVDGMYYLKPGYMFLPQNLIIRLVKAAEDLTVPKF